MKNILRLALLLLPMTVLAQPPQVPMNGNIGSNFNGPLINSPAVVFTSDADHTMVYPEMSGDAGPLIVTSSVTLTATRNLFVPNTGNFTWPVKNMTTGGQTINVKVSGGSSVPVADGMTVTVVCDGTNCTAPQQGTITAVTGTAPVDCTTTGSSVNCSVFYDVRKYGATGNGSTDDSTAINAAVSALNAAGRGTLYFPAGNYLTSTCGYTISVPATVEGEGIAVYDNSQWSSLINCTSPTASLFTMTAKVGNFKDIALTNTAATPTSGAGVLGAIAGGSFAGQEIDFDHVSVTGFYDDIHQNGAGWKISGSDIGNWAHYGVWVQNTINADWGDWVISDSNFGADSHDGPAAVYIDSSGGGKINHNKFVGASAYDIELNPLTANNALELGIDRNNMEGSTGAAIYGPSSWWLNTTIDSNIIGRCLGPCIQIANPGNLYIGGGNMTSGLMVTTPTAIALTGTITTTTIAPFQYDAALFVAPVTWDGSTVIPTGAGNQSFVQTQGSDVNLLTSGVVGVTANLPFCTDSLFGATTNCTAFNSVTYPSSYSQYALLTAPTATSVGSLLPSSWTPGHTFLPVYQPSGSAIAPTVVDANTLNVNSALTASNVNCTASDTCPNDNVWQSSWTTLSQLQLATGYPLGSGDSTMTVVTLAGIPTTGHAVTTSEEEIGFTYVSSSGGNSTYNITRGHHNTTPAAVTVAQGNMSGVVSETAACSACAVVWQLGNGNESSNGEQLNAGLRPNVNGSYIYADQNLSVGTTGYIVLGALVSGAPGLAVSGIAGSYGHVIAQPAADTSTDGYLAHADWNTFNGKLSSLSGALLATGATTGGTSQPQAFTDGVIPSNLTVGYVPYAESTDKKLVNSPIYTDGIKVGIGTTNLTGKFTIVGAGSAGSTFDVGASGTVGNYIDMYGNATDGGTVHISTNYWTTDGSLALGSLTTPDSVTIKPNGNVSIGDTTAAAMFNVGTANQFQVSSTGVSSAGAGSTDYSTASSAQEAHCLADGTGCPAAGSSVSLGGALSCSNLTLGTGAGTGASCTSVTGLDSNFTVSIETGSSPLPYSYLVDIFAITFTTSRGHNTACTYSPANLSAAGLYGSTSPWMIDSTSPTETSMQPGSTGLTGSTTYDWNVVCP